MPSFDRESRPQSLLPTDEQVRERAYEIYLERAGRPGSAESDWIQAQQELVAAMNRVPSATPPAAAPKKRAAVPPASVQEIETPAAPHDGVQMPPVVRTTRPAKKPPAEETAPVPRRSPRGRAG